MVVFEHIHLEVFEILVAERTAVMTPHCLLDAMAAVNMSAPGDVAVSYWIEADGALELVF